MGIKVYPRALMRARSFSIFPDAKRFICGALVCTHHGTITFFCGAVRPIAPAEYSGDGRPTALLAKSFGTDSSAEGSTSDGIAARGADGEEHGVHHKQEATAWRARIFDQMMEEAPSQAAGQAGPIAKEESLLAENSTRERAQRARDTARAVSRLQDIVARLRLVAAEPSFENTRIQEWATKVLGGIDKEEDKWKAMKVDAALAETLSKENANRLEQLLSVLTKVYPLDQRNVGEAFSRRYSDDMQEVVQNLEKEMPRAGEEDAVQDESASEETKEEPKGDGPGEGEHDSHNETDEDKKKDAQQDGEGEHSADKPPEATENQAVKEE